MALAVDVEQLLKGGVMEWERIDFKKTFHALSLLRSICAFANDINNRGGGYIVIGVEQDDQGHPILPARGLSPGEIHIIQIELPRLCQYLRPSYYPILDVVNLKNNKQIVIIWAPAGSSRPYQAPLGLSKLTNYSYYIRKTSLTRQANESEQAILIAAANQIPFDSRINQLANITDINLGLVQSYLTTIKSDLSHQSKNMDMAELYRRMNIVDEYGKELKPKNVGLLLFNLNPQRFFPQAYIEIGDCNSLDGCLREHIFTGPLLAQLESALTYIKGMVITKWQGKLVKKGPSFEYFNYPFAAIKEALINAVYHRSYQGSSPIEINVHSNHIEIISYPGPLPPLDNYKLKSGQLNHRSYRNPGLGHYLKQMKLVKAKATGLEAIKEAMNNNGSPPPVFKTDKKLTFFEVFLPIHPKFALNLTKLGPQEKRFKDINEIVLSLYQVCPKSIDIKAAAVILLSAKEEISLEKLMFDLGGANKTRFRNAFIKPLMELNLIDYTIKGKPNSSKQKYILTEKGRVLIEAASWAAFEKDCQKL